MDILELYSDIKYKIVFITKCNDSIGIDLMKDTDSNSVAEQLYKLELVAITLIDEERRNNFITQQILGAQGIILCS